MALQDMNAAFCELTSFYLLSQDKHVTVVPAWAGRVVDHVLGVFGQHIVSGG
jgi:hypothetical protein